MKHIALLLCFFVISCSSDHPSKKVLVNQLGYGISGQKKAIILTDKKIPFKVINVENKEVLYQGMVESISKDDISEEWIGYADFTLLTKIGKYVIEVEGIGTSPAFMIDKNLYSSLPKMLLRNLFLHRAGEDLSPTHAKEWARKKFVVESCYLWSNHEQQRRCQGGWYDAGDYGRYAITTSVTAAYLLQSYQFFPNLFKDDLGIPETGNGVADILDEAKVGLKLLFQLQCRQGGVYHKATTKKFARFGIRPSDKDYYHKHKVYFFDRSLTATFDFAAVMALASRMYKKIDKTFSKKCLVAAKKAWKWAHRNLDKKGFSNPKGVSTGPYYDEVIKDERFWAAVELYLATGSKKYSNVALRLVKDIQDGANWNQVSALAYLSFLKSGTRGLLRDRIEDRVINWRNDKVNVASKNPWEIVFDRSTLCWSSNGLIAQAAISGIIGNLVEKKKEDNGQIQNYLHYFLGRNPLGISFITGVGSFQIHKPYHRLSFIQGHAMPGMVIGGINQRLEDPITKKYFKDTPIGKRHIDHPKSYSTNENAIDLNGYLIFLVSYLVHSDLNLEKTSKSSYLGSR